MVIILFFWNILFKVCNNACIMTRFGKNHFHQVLLSVLKMNDTVNNYDNCFVHFSGYQNRTFHSKSVVIIKLCLVLKKSLFSTIFLNGLRVNHSVNIENYF